MAHDTHIADVFNEQASATITAVLQDEDGDPVGSGDIDTLTLTLTDKRSGDVINGRAQSDILGENGGTLDAEGNLALILGELDMAIVDFRREIEMHIALIEWTYGDGLTGKYVIEFQVKNLHLVGQAS